MIPFAIQRYRNQSDLIKHIDCVDVIGVKRKLEELGELLVQLDCSQLSCFVVCCHVGFHACVAEFFPHIDLLFLAFDVDFCGDFRLVR